MTQRASSRPGSSPPDAHIARGIVAIVVLTMSGCYLSHGRDDAGASRDGGRRDSGPLPLRDAGPLPLRDAGRDAGARSCCTRWAFDRRVAIDDFSHDTVTPRLFAIGDRVGLLVTGPPDPAGPSGAHYLRFSRDLAAHEPPRAVTSGSFTWGQPASRGDRFAVCWGGAGTGNAVRVFDAEGRAVSEQARLDTSVESPCVASAYAEGQFAFAYMQGGATEPPRVRVRLVDAETGSVGGSFDVDATAPETSVSLAGIEGVGFATAVTLGSSTYVLHVIDADARAIARSVGADSRRVRLVASGASLTLLRVFTRAVAGTREEDVLALDGFTVPSLSPGVHFELATFEPPPSPSFAATAGTCGEAVLAIALPALGVVEGSARLSVYTPDVPAPPSLRGDTSALVMEDDAYVAFTAVDPATSRAEVQIDRWVCASR